MSTLIPSSALKFYAENTHVTEVTGGTSAGDILYPKLTFPFTESYTGLNLAIGPGFTGRGTLTANKTFNCGSDSLPFIASLVGGENLSQSNFSASWSGTGEVLNEQDICRITIPKFGGTLTITFYDVNSKNIIVENLLTRGIWSGGTVNGITLSAAQMDVAYIVPNDLGYVKGFNVTLVITFPENSGIEDINCGTINIGNNIGDNVGALLSAYPIEIIQTSDTISLSTNSVTLHHVTGIASSPVTVAADANWTIS